MMMSVTRASVVIASNGNNTGRVNHWPSNATGMVISCAKAMFIWNMLMIRPLNSLGTKCWIKIVLETMVVVMPMPNPRLPMMALIGV